VIRRLLTVVPAAFLVAACGTPTLSRGAEPVADAVSATTSAAAATTEPTTEPTTAATTSPTAAPVEDVVPAQAVAQPTVIRAAAPVAAAPRVAAPVAARRTTSKPATPKPVAKATTKPSTLKPAPVSPGGCNVNYTPCVPDDPTDVDCQGGKGNGPSYVKGPVTVTGTDVYGLDADHDGIGCE
jgi:hypothetical protein